MHILVIETYPGVDDEEVIPQLETLNPSLFINMKDIFKSEEVLTEQLKYNLTDDRVFGRMYYGEIIDFIDEERLQEAKTMVAQNGDLVIVYGYGASLVTKDGTLVYLDMARWEIQTRYHQGMGNYKCSNFDEDFLKKIKRGFFIEWRVADKHKNDNF